MDRGAWRATVYGVTKLDMTEWLTLLSFSLSSWEHCPVWGAPEERGSFTGQSVGLPEKLKIERENPRKARDVLIQILLKYLAARNCAWAEGRFREPSKKQQWGRRDFSCCWEKGVWNSSSTELEEFGSCLRFSFEMLEGPHLMIKPKVKGHTLRLN